MPAEKPDRRKRSTKSPEAPPPEPSDPRVIERTETEVKLPKTDRPRPTVHVVKTVRHNEPPAGQPRGSRIRRTIG